MIESLFFFCYYSYLLGDLSNTEIYYSIIQEEFKISGHKDSLKHHQFVKLRQIKGALKNKTIYQNKWLDNPEYNGPKTSPKIEMKQKELVKKIHLKGINQLKEILNDNIYLYNIEHPCGSYGAVDMIYMGKDTIYPLEVKRNCGEHDLIGQISKYDLFHRLQLHYKHYEHVQSITLCNSYNTFVVKELYKMGFIPLLYNLTENGINIRRAE